MQGITVRNILEITHGHLIGEIDESKRQEILETEVKSLAIDSRKVKEGSLFVAIIGEKVDAHKFVPACTETAAACLVQEDEQEIVSKADGQQIPANKAVIRVDDTIKAMQAIAAYVRGFYKHPVIGVTGSVGKTTTREMITHALSSGKNVFHTKKNLNSQIGVALTLSKLIDEPSDVAVLEMGISEVGEMDRLTEMAKPDIAVVTMIGVAHIEYLKDKEGIRTEKLKIASRMDENGVLFLNADDDMLWEMKGKTGVKTFYFGTRPEADFRVENIRVVDEMNTFDYVHGDERILVTLKAFGLHHVLDAAAAMAICDYLGMDMMSVAGSLEGFIGIRQKIINTDSGVIIIDDSYNASPDSMKAAINVLGGITNTGRKIAVLGDMYELGEDTDLFHREIGGYVRSAFAEGDLDELYTIGEKGKLIAEAALMEGFRIKTFLDKEKLTDYLIESLKPGDAVVIKASNGVHLSEVVEKLVDEFDN